LIAVIDTDEDLLYGTKIEKSEKVFRINNIKWQKEPENADTGYFGKITYKTEITAPGGYDKYILEFKEIHDICSIFINGQFAVKLFMSPWEADITDYLTFENVKITVEVLTSMANKFGKPVKVGIE
jgi:hypothetical protein